MESYYWRERAVRGGQQVSPEFATPEEAGIWLLEHPPLSLEGPTLVKVVDGIKVSVPTLEFLEAVTVGLST